MAAGQTRTSVRDFEGLVIKTARMFAAQVGREECDLAQELRVRVWRAIQSWDGDRFPSLERYVFIAVTNKIKDFKRDAAREKARREREGVSFVHIEDMAPGQFEGHYHTGRERVYGRIDGEMFVLPSTVTETEATIALLLVQEVSRLEIAIRLDLSDGEITAAVRHLQIKLADWRPTRRPVPALTSQLELAA